MPIEELDGHLTLRDLRVRCRIWPGPEGTSPPPVVVLHGWRASLEAVMPIAAGLAPHAPVVSLDLPGFGSSEVPRTGWGVADYGDLVLEAMDAAGAGRFMLVGHSFGARIGIELGSRPGSRVTRLVLTGAAGIRPRRP